MDAHRLLTVKTGNITLQPDEVDFLRQEISTREQSIATLLSECKTLKGLLAPLRRQAVPPETLGEIFYHAIWQAEPDYDCDHAVDQRLLNICLVCKAWRSAALGAPRLWCTIEDFPLAAPITGDFSQVETWFKHAGSLPKTIELYEIDHVDRIPEDCQSVQV
ncbi:hypothetical protein FA13DRAFT_1793924 [Coprinellus micaceus]|uniref:Uncharacterized protein n=1 Tax=Coprinellus micaceus TaxID=71717 RepID=A0A4Y7T2R2_COPMI|nr:hypothetical protein FA13DRAFT_1793924 [Coprinellus micaceus]